MRPGRVGARIPTHFWDATKAVGQLAYYMAWVRQNLADGKHVRGVIVAREVSDELKMAVSMLAGVTIHQYELHVTLAKVG